MASIPIKRVISVSSEDKLNPAANLLRAGSGRKWLTSAEDKYRKAEVVVELCKRARINNLEICNFGSAFIEIHVSSPSPPEGSDFSSASEEWLTLLPSCMLMTVADSRAGRNKTTSLAASHDRFSTTAANLKWSRIKIICRQPYNLTSQFGLQRVAFYSDISSLTPPTSLPPSRSSLSSPSSQPPNEHTITPYKLPSLPSLTTSNKPGDPNSSKTPQWRLKKHPLGETDEENKEFSGVEKQSRLLKNALKTSKEGVEQLNPVLIRARQHYDEEWKKGLEDTFARKKRLNRELCKAQGMSDFVASYEKSRSPDVAIAFRKISHLDNKSEIGQEENHHWSRGSRRRGGGGGGGGGRGRRRKSTVTEDKEEVEEAAWVSRRKKKLKGMIQDCQRVLSLAGDAGGTSGRPEDIASTTAELDTSPKKGSVAVDSDSDSDATIIMDNPQPPTDPLQPLQSVETSLGCSSSSSSSVPCPMCGQSFPVYAIELHAASCGDSVFTTTTTTTICID